MCSEPVLCASPRRSGWSTVRSGRFRRFGKFPFRSGAANNAPTTSPYNSISSTCIRPTVSGVCS